MVKKVGIFIDDSNIFYAQKKAGWKVDFEKLRNLLEKECKIVLMRYYIAIPNENDESFKATHKYLEYLREKKFSIKSKPLKYIHTSKGIIKKGDVDLEIALDVVRTLSSLDIVIIVSGDSDYLELKRYVLENRKHMVFCAFKHNMAWELKEGKYILFDKILNWVEGHKKTPGTKPERILPV